MASESGEPPDVPNISVELTVATESGGLSVDALGDLCSRLVSEACRGVCAGGAVRARLVGDAEMASAHERYCGVIGTTDVITFDLADGRSAMGEPLDVDLIVCVDEAVRQAAARGHALETELALYTLHGVLHALGYDDLDEEAYERMHTREDEVFRALGLGAAFGRGERE